MDKLSYLSNAHPEFIEQLYKDYKNNPESVDVTWRKFFEGFEFAQSLNGHADASSVSADPPAALKEIYVLNLINEYRTRGHLFTKTNPVRDRRSYEPKITLERFGLSDADMDTVFQSSTELGIGPQKLRVIVDHLTETYCDAIGAEFRFMRSPERIDWLQKKMETSKNTPNFNIEEKKHILEKLMSSVVFENYLHSKYVGQKRFALSGGETLIPALDAIITKGANLGVKEFVIGMAHRGRLNVLANIMGKSLDDIFVEFEGGEYLDTEFEADVKYHLGYSSNVITANNKEVHLNLVPNPSHLEAVAPVVNGVVRAKVDKRYDGDYDKCVPIIIHGDAAIAGQGIAYEVVQMAHLDGYKNGGSIHLVVNNQIGFTTNYLDARSSTYCTDVAKVTRSPVFHVNADDVEAVMFTILMAMEYRNEFNGDVFIDLLGYRKYGHNESDEPRFTQPKLYKAIAAHKDSLKIYMAQLEKEGQISSAVVQGMEDQYRATLQKSQERAKKNMVVSEISTFKSDWKGIRKAKDDDFLESPKTGITKKDLMRISEKIFTVPDDIKAFRKIRKVYEDRMKRLVEKEQFDWAMGETLAYASLLDSGTPVRLSGQDVERGTFSHRHAVLINEETEDEYIPLNNISDKQAQFRAYNSLLSEYGVLGFEYGYASAYPNGLTIWEAQFGDFANGAQIIIDQFISSSDAKWRRYNGLVMLLPHGYEGQGPEHSSARMERFLNLCAYKNMQVLNCTTPASLYHAMRRQIVYPFRIPMVIFTPKSLLRHPLCVSPVSDFIGNSKFEQVIDDPIADPKKVKRVLFCTGKVYYDLLEKQTREGREDVAIARLEQIYPIAYDPIATTMKRYPNAKATCWIQEEPENMGAWGFLHRKLRLNNMTLVSRLGSASPATGVSKHHKAEQEALVQLAFGDKCKNNRKVINVTL
ncbi:MAG: 2-oxoglutarate dehydrogenase E1 component [Calditrichia bacterium]